MAILPAVKRILNCRLFVRRDSEFSLLGIFKWWEIRRVPFNFIVGLTGVFTIAAIIPLYLLAEKLHQNILLPPPLLLIFSVFAYGVMANVCFTFGFVSEIIARKIWGQRAEAFAEIAFAFGLFFSVALTLLPIVVVAALIALEFFSIIGHR